MAERTVPVVQTVGLCKTFSDFWRRPQVEAVKDLSLEIRPGEVFGLLGPNGSGKTTTIKMLLGLLYPTRGRISVFGRAPSDVEVKSRIGFLPEDSYLYRFLVAHETLDYYGRLFQLPKRVRKERTEHLLDMVGLRHEAKRRVGEYSKGMARRIGLAQALINDPEFLILDEPTSGLDPIGARQIKDVIRELGRKGKTILLSSHVLADVEDVCDRVMILYGGQDRAAGDISELLRKTDSTQITTSHLSSETIAMVTELIKKYEKPDFLEVSNPRVRLEDYFLGIVQEAQAANVRTSGARSGGELPEFLQQATESAAGAVIDSLVFASRSPTAPKESQPIVEEPSRELIDQLLGARDDADASPPSTQESDSNAGESRLGEGAVARPDEAGRPRDAERGVIDGLLGAKPSDDRKSRDGDT